MSVHAVEMIDTLAENFKMRVGDFCSHATNICILENPFSLEISDASEKLQPKLIELQYDSVLRSSFNQEALITSYTSLPASWFSVVCKLAQNLASVFGSM
jgi:hypothetical protein